jgi:predicted nucleotide-binding protein
VQKYEEKMRYPIEIKGKTTKQVTKLNLSGLGLKEFPENVFDYTNLTKLVLSNNRIKVIPKDILKLKKLKVLDLANNDISTLHSSVFRLPKLRTLNVYGNQIKKFPKQICESNIRVLIAGSNQIEEFDLSVLNQLEEVDLTNNLIKRLVIPESLPCLKVLRAKDNPLELEPDSAPIDLIKTLKFCDLKRADANLGDDEDSFKAIQEVNNINKGSECEAATEESELIDLLHQATKAFVLEWNQCEEYIYEGIFQGTSYRLWMDIMPYSETHEYFAYGLAVFHEKWNTIVYEEEDPESTILSGLGEKLSKLYNLATNKKHSRIRKEIQITTNRNDKMEELSNRIFIVHGHNELMKQHVARTVSELGLKPIILHEQPNGGKTIIEKFLSNAEKSGFAVILLSADDLGISKRDKEKAGKEGKQTDDVLSNRARQNVVFEMGCFIGLLGRPNVFLLLEESVEKPGDLDGIVYNTYDKNGAWRFDLVKEMKNCGYNVSADSLL